VPRLVKRASDLDPVRMALDLALGRRPATQGTFTGFALHYLVPSPPDATVLERPPDPNALLQVPGVHAVESLPPGTELDWRRGTASQLCTVWAEAPTLEAARRVYEQVDDVVAETAVVAGQSSLVGAR
jgi:hypothetical protein